jgi:Domain of unknown function (DUF4136)
MKSVGLVSVALFSLAASAAGAQDVRYKFDRNAEFSKFKTYKWIPIPYIAKADVVLDKEIKDAADAELTKKGLTKTEADTADLYIAYLAGIGTEVQFSSYNTGWGYGPGWTAGDWRGAGGSMTTGPNYYGIYAGQLAFDMNDSGNHALVWRGLASKAIDPNVNPEKQKKDLVKAIDKLLKSYPPPSAMAK